MPSRVPALRSPLLLSFAVLSLLCSCGVLVLPSASAQLLASPAGVSLQQPLLLRGVDVGATLQRMGEQLSRQQALIDELLRRNSTNTALLQQYEQRIEHMQQTINEQQTHIEEIRSNGTGAGAISELSAKIDALLTPTRVHAEAGSEQATVRWSLGSATVTAYPGGAICETDGLSGEQQCTVGGLTNGVNYTFTARLSNAAGAGPVSLSSNSVVPQLDCFELSAATTGDGGVVTANPASSANCPAGEYAAGTLVTLTAIPDAGYGVSWSGPSGGVADAALLIFSLRMPEAAATVVAAFARCFPLAVDVLVGSGSAVIAAPSSTAGCAAGAFVPGASVTLKATPAAGWSFNGWSGTVAAGFGTSVWSFVMPGSAATQRASFAQCLPLTVSRQPADGSGGSVSLSPPHSDGCPAGRFLQGAALILTATPAAGWGFAGWTGALSSSDAAWSYTMGSAAAVQTARFGQCFPLTLTATGAAGSIASAAAPNSHGCAAGSYASGAVLSLSVTVPSSASFLRWSGSGASGASPTLSYSMPAAAASVTAELSDCLPVSASAGGDGSVTVLSAWPHSCPLNQFPIGAPLTVTALAGVGKSFTKWTGSLGIETSSVLRFNMPPIWVTLIANIVPCVQLTASAVPLSGATGSVSTTSAWNHTCAAGWWPQGAPITVQAVAGSLSTFAQWTDGNTNNSRTLTMPAAALTLSATFKPCRLLTLTASGCGTVGTPTPATSFSCPAGRFVDSASVSIPVTADANCTFSGWSGNSASPLAPLTFNMPASDAALQANFKQCYELSLPTAGAAGTVTANPTKSLACAAGSYVAGEAVTLTAWSDGTVSSFRTWSGDATDTTNPLAFTMPASSATVKATFVACVVLNVNSVGDGATSSVLGSPTTTWSHTCGGGRFPRGAPITAEVTTNSGTTFLDWTGGVTSTANPVTFTMPATTTSITCRLAQCFSLTMNPGTGGTVAVPTPASIGTCDAGTYPRGIAVTLKATPNSGYTFSQWSGSTISNSATLVYTTILGNSTLMVTFAPQCYMLTRTSLNPTFGSISTPSPPNSVGCAANTFMASESVTVTALPIVSYTFTQWGGVASGNSSTTTFTMPAVSTTLQASFALRDFVYGQMNFTLGAANSAAAPAGGLSSPFGIAVGLSDELYVADLSNHRVLVYPFGSLTPTRAIGQANLVGKAANRGQPFCSASTLSGPANVKIDDSGAVWVVDRNNYRVLVFPPGDTTTTATRVYGQLDSFTTSAFVVNENGLNLPSDVAFGDGGVFIADTYNHRVLYYPGASTTATRLYGQASFTTAVWNLKGTTGLYNPRSVAVDSTGGLYVGDYGNNRILFFPQGSTTATRVIGQADYVSSNPNRGQINPTDATLAKLQAIVLRPDGLYVCDTDVKRVLRFPLNNSTADRVWGQPDFVTKTLQPIGDGVFSAPYGLTFDSRGDMYVSDMTWNRVLRITL